MWVGFEFLPLGAQRLDAVMNEVADVADAGLHDLADLFVVETGDEFQTHGFALSGGQGFDEAAESRGGFA